MKIKKLLKSVIAAVLLFAMILSIPLTATTAADKNSPVTAIPSSQKVLVNGKETPFDAYYIDGFNYFKLRDLAFVLSETQKQFDVDFYEESNVISLTSGKSYTVVGGEMAGKGSGNKTGIPTTSEIYLDGKQVKFTAYNIGGNNYFKLRDVMEKIDVYVGWDDPTKTITLDTSNIYYPVYTTLKGQLGLNIGGAYPWRSADIFVDIMKNSLEWSGPVDELGWPLGDSSIRIGYIHLKGIYKLSFNGKADISTFTGGIWNPNYTVENIVVTGNETDGYFTTADVHVNFVTENFRDDADEIGFGFSNTENPDKNHPGRKGVSNVKLILPGYEETDTFTDEFIRSLEPFSVLRTMDFTKANNDPSGLWKDRALPTSYSQTSSKGAAWEYAIEVANLTNKDLWVNIPTKADDDYIRQMATLLRDNLRPNVNIYVEWSNEVWGFEFPRTENQQKAAELGINEQQHYAKRTADIALIFGEVFGEGSLNNRIKAVLAWQNWNPADFIKNMMRFLISKYDAIPGSYNASGKYTNPNQYIYAAAVAPYFAEPAADLCVDVATIHRNMIADIKSNQSRVKAGVKYTADYGLPGGFITYEGGPHHAPGGQVTTNLATRTAAQKDPLMTEIMKYYIVNNWYGLGANLYMHYSHVGKSSQWGYWGCMDDFTEDQFENAPKYKALREISAMPLVGYELVPEPKPGK